MPDTVVFYHTNKVINITVEIQPHFLHTNTGYLDTRALRGDSRAAELGFRRLKLARRAETMRATQVGVDARGPVRSEN